MTARFFVDTNVIVYSQDRKAGLKHETAVLTLEELLLGEIPPCISVQILHETYSVLTKKGMPVRAIDNLMEDLMQWQIVANTKEVFINGMKIQRRWKISIWDALIIAAAREAGAKQILSEDLTHHEIYDDIKVINPFIKS